MTHLPNMYLTSKQTHFLSLFCDLLDKVLFNQISIPFSRDNLKQWQRRIKDFFLTQSRCPGYIPKHLFSWYWAFILCRLWNALFFSIYWLTRKSVERGEKFISDKVKTTFNPLGGGIFGLSFPYKAFTGTLKSLRNGSNKISVIYVISILEHSA